MIISPIIAVLVALIAPNLRSGSAVSADRCPIPSSVRPPPPPPNAPLGFYVQVERSTNRAYLRYRQEDRDKVIYACRVSTAGKGHSSPKGWQVIYSFDKDPEWKPSDRERRMWVKAHHPLPKGTIKGGDPRNELGRMRWRIGHDPLCFHGTNNAANIGFANTRGCVSFNNGDILAITKHLRRRKHSRIYVS